jgi:hypothetical protein
MDRIGKGFMFLKKSRKQFANSLYCLYFSSAEFSFAIIEKAEIVRVHYF